jgi:NSS family neurotransmitter:Na+ symporter
VFVTLPALFEAMPGGMFVGIAFFFLLIVAALSSAISLLEVVVAYFVDEKGMSRGRATLGFGFLIWALGVACAFSAGGGVLSFLDDVTTRYTLPIGGLIIAIIAGWLIRPVDREAGFGDMGALGALAANGWLFVIRFLTPVAVLLVILNKMGLVRFGG